MATTKTKKPAAKKTAVVKAHRGMAHVPRRSVVRTRKRPPNLEVEPRRKGDNKPRGIPMTPTMRRRIMDRQRDMRGRNPRIMTPAQRDAMRRQRQAALARRRAIEALRRRQRDALNREALKPSDRPVLPLRKRPTVEQLSNARRRRRPVGDPKPRTPQKKRPTGTPRVPQAQPTPRVPPPRRRRFRFRRPR